MPDLPEEAIIAAAKAIFERSIIADWDRATKTRRWLDGAHEYRDIARAALLAALPHLHEHR